MTVQTLTFSCARCGQTTTDPLAWRCPACEGPLEISNPSSFDAEAIRQQEWSLWRYAAMLPAARRFTLGEGMTPLVPVKLDDIFFLAKLEFVSPTGSYKDRGVAVLLNYLLSQNVGAIVEDSSGNAGAAVAAYAAGIGMTARIFAPAGGASAKKAQIAQYGAILEEITGPREAVTAACEAAAQTAAYATHAWNPVYLAGQMTGAWEVWEQMSQRPPEAVVCPVGQGGLFLGLARGFQALHDAGLIDTVPRMYAVQSAAYDPVVRAWETGAEDPGPISGGDTIADGIRIAAPVRGREILAAIRATGGAAFRVEDNDIRQAHGKLARQGLFVEPTSAVPVAALPAVQTHLAKISEILIPLTGSGLKNTQFADK